MLFQALRGPTGAVRSVHGFLNQLIDVVSGTTRSDGCSLDDAWPRMETAPRRMIVRARVRDQLCASMSSFMSSLMSSSLAALMSSELYVQGGPPGRPIFC